MPFSAYRTLTAVACLCATAAFGEFEATDCARARLAFADEPSPSGRQYAPSREIDLLHLAIDVTPDFQQRSIAAKATVRFKPIAQPFAELKLDAVDLRVEAVTATEKMLGWQATERQVIVTFEQPIPPDKEVSVTIAYRATPRQGLYFRTPEMGYRAGDMHLWTQGEAIEARHWFPCFDAPNEKFTSEITCHVPEGMVVLSNGRLVSQEKDAAGLLAVRWLQDKPHVSYLISLIAGHLKKVEDRYKDIPLAFYVPASQINYAARSFKDTKDMMAFFEQEIGVAYPWAKYYQVCVEDFTAGGMENTSITTLNDYTLHTAEFEELRDSQGLVAHELSHQWFGDLVTCKDWAHLWLNEGFATYYEHLYDEHQRGREMLLYRQFESARFITGQPNQTNAIVRRDFRDPNEQFGYLAYPKGAWVLHMLRCQLGADLYRRCIRNFLERHLYGTVETEDLVRVIEELSGRSWDQFFDQYVYHAAQPELGVSYSWDERSKLAKVSISQNQKLSDAVLLFHVPLTIRFKTKSGAADRQITVRQKTEDFFFPLAQAPEVVRLDPELALLAKITFAPPTPMLYAQLTDPTDMLGRLIAVEQLEERKERAAVGKLKDVLNGDSFFAVRLAAANALRTIDTDEAFDALAASTKQGDARVRRAVVDAMGGFYREAAYAKALQMLRDEKNPEIIARLMASLAGFTKPEVRETLLKHLRSDSFRNVLADAAIGAMRSQDDPAYLKPLREVLKQKETAFTTGGFGRGLEALAYLARNENKKDDVREFILAHLDSKKPRVQLAAISALGTLGDPKAIAPLQKLATGRKDAAEAKAAERAIADLRAARKPAAEIGSIRGEVLSLQKDNRELRRDLDELKKKFEALSPKPADEKPKDTKPAAAPPKGS